MSFPSTPRKGGQATRRFAGSGLEVACASTVLLSEKFGHPSQWIMKFGKFQLVFAAIASPNDVVMPTVNNVDFNIFSYVEAMQVAMTAHVYSPNDELDFGQDANVLVHGTLCPWEYRIKARDSPDGDNIWQMLLTTSLSNIQVLENLAVVDPEKHIQQTNWIGCSFLGRVRDTPDPAVLTLADNMMGRLRDHGVFVELQFYFNPATEAAGAGLLRTQAYSFYVFLLFDESARKRHKWALKDGKPSFRDSEYIYCAGRIIGKLKSFLVTKAGYEQDTPSDKCPIYVVVIGEGFRPTTISDTATPGAGAAPLQSGEQTPLQRRLMQSARKQIPAQVGVPKQAAEATPTAGNPPSQAESSRSTVLASSPTPARGPLSVASLGEGFDMDDSDAGDSTLPNSSPLKRSPKSSPLKRKRQD